MPIAGSSKGLNDGVNVEYMYFICIECAFHNCRSSIYIVLCLYKLSTGIILYNNRSVGKGTYLKTYIKGDYVAIYFTYQFTTSVA